MASERIVYKSRPGSALLSSLRVFFVLMLLAIPRPAAADDGTTVLSVALFDGCPFICLDESGPFVDGLKRAFAGSRYELQFRQMPFARAVKDLQSGRLDLLPGILKNGIDNAIFPDSWLYFTQMCFFSEPDDTWKWDGLQSLEGRLVAVEKGIVHTPDFFAHAQANPSVTHLSGDGILPRQMRMLKLGRIQSFTAEQTVLAHYLELNGIASDSLRNAGCFDPEFEYVAINRFHPDVHEIRQLLTKELAK